MKVQDSGGRTRPRKNINKAQFEPTLTSSLSTFFIYILSYFLLLF